MTAAASLAKEAAGGKDVLFHGARAARLALAPGVLDELQIHLVPVLLGEGEPLSEEMPPEHIVSMGPLTPEYVDGLVDRLL